MKSLQLALRAVGFTCIAFFMSSATCQLFDDVDDITFNAVLNHPFDIHEGLSYPNGKLYETEDEDEILDAAEVNQDFAANADLIQEIKINKLEYVLSGFSSSCPPSIPISFSNGTLTFSDPDGSGNVLSKPVSHADLKAAQGTVFTLPLTQSEADELANLLKDKKKIRIEARGFVSCTPLFLTVKATLDCTITAEIL